MSENKLVEKTKEVFYKQKELTDLIDDLKDEVKKVYYENKELTDQNKLLKEEITLLKNQIHLDEVKSVEETVPVEGEFSSTIAEEVPEEIKVQETTIEEPIYQDPIKEEVPNYFNEPSDKVLQKNAIAEFFLGKNVIAKIAAILIFLGVLTFGQMAYVDWLNDVGRALLILFTGLVFGAVALWSERRRYIVFSNVFYGISLFIIFYTILLAGFQFMLFSSLWISVLLLMLLLATMVYFKDKRYEFLDSILFTFILVIGYAFLYCLETLDPVFATLFSILFISAIGLSAYQLVAKVYKHKEGMKFSFQVIQLVGILYFFIFMMFQDELFMSNSFSVVLFTVLQIGIIYIINVGYDFDEHSKFTVVSPIFTLGGLYPLSALLCMAVLRNENIASSITFLVFTVLVIPLYVYLYRKFKETSTNISVFYLYTLGLSYLAFALSASSPLSMTLYPLYTRILIMGLGTGLVYVVMMFLTKEKVNVLFRLYLVVFSIFIFLEFFASSHLTKEFLTDAIILGVVSASLILVNVLIKYWKKLEPVIDKELLKLFMVYAFVPVIVILMKEYVSDDNAYLMAVIMVWLVGNRWLGELKPLKTTQKNNYVLVLNILIVTLTFLLNLIYFDHDFTQFKDVFKLLFMLVVNGYIVLSLKEVYVNHFKQNYPESSFIILYLIGVLIHSYYIHMYINIEFDKVILSSYFLIASAIGVLIGFRKDWSISRRLGLFAIYFSLGKFFIYDFYTQDFSSFVRMMTYFILGFVLLGISMLYAYLERTYGKQ